jgi:pyruvate dehydrogenase E1 component alpha subunit
MGDPERYRESDEIEKWREDDPIGIFRKHLLDDGGVSAEALDAEEALVETEVEQAVSFAESSPDPAPDALFDDIYTDS